MKKRKVMKRNRREFLQQTLHALAVAPAAKAAFGSVSSANEEDLSWNENGKPLPGDPGYRDPEAYGSESEGLAE